MPESEQVTPAGMGVFAVSETDAKHVVSKLIRMLVLATNRHKLDYGTLRYIHRQTLARAKLRKPRPGKRLYELPTSEELEQFFAVIPDQQIKLLFALMHNCGLRVAEVCNVKIQDIDVTNSTIMVNGKGDKDRVIPLTPKVMERIQLFIHGKKLRYLFESKLGTRYTTRRIEQLCKQFKSEAGIEKKFTPHTFRHYYFSKLAELGVDVDIRALLAGHSSTRTQEVYSHLGLAGSRPVIMQALEQMEARKILK